MMPDMVKITKGPKSENDFNLNQNWRGNQITSPKINRKLSAVNAILPPMNFGLAPEQQRKYTLVLDLDETLVHFD
jgi:hypothetical protein